MRQYKKLPVLLKEEVKRAINLFREQPNHPVLRVHKLKGRLNGSLSMSVNYRYRIVFEYESSKTAEMLVVGDHSIYE